MYNITNNYSHSWLRVPKPPVLWRLPHPTLPSPLLNFWPPPHPPPNTHTHTHTHTHFLLPYFFDWMCDHATCDVILFNDIMDLHMPSLKEPAVCSMQQSISLLRSNAWCSFLLVLWFDSNYDSALKALF